MTVIEETNTNSGFKPCECDCGRLIPLINKKGKPARFFHGHNAVGKNNWQWKNGETTNSQGYRLIRSKNHIKASKGGYYVRKHVLIFEEHHKCCMLPWSVVHHIDRNKQNNNIENLQGMMRTIHQSLHHKKDMSGRVCLLCKSDKTYYDKRGWFTWFRFGNGFICVTCKSREYYNNKKKNKIKI